MRTQPTIFALMKRFGLSTALLAAGVASAHAQATITILDAAGDVGRLPALAIGADGLGLVAYLDSTTATLKMAHCSNAACSAATVSTIDAADVAIGPGLAIGADGLGFVTYASAGTGALKVAHCSDVACTSASSSVINTNVVGGVTSVAIGTDGLPLIAYSRQRGSTWELAAAHCANVACTSAAASALGSLLIPRGNFDTSVAIGTDGLGLIAYIPWGVFGGPNASIGIAHCANAACTALTPGAPTARSDAPLVGQSHLRRPSLVIGADGLGLLSYRRTYIGIFPFNIFDYHIRHCADTACTAFTSDVSIPTEATEGEMANEPLVMGADGKPWFARHKYGKVRLSRCDDASCLTWSDSCAITPGGAEGLSTAVGADAQPLIAFYAPTPGDMGVIHGSAPCPVPAVSVGDAQMNEEGGPVAAPVQLDVLTDVPATVEYTMVPGTAVAGVDYYPQSGLVSFPAGSATGTVLALIPLPDLLDEDDEQFQVLLQNPQGITIGDGSGVVTIIDDDPPPTLRIDGCSLVEGTGAPTPCAFTASLSTESGRTVSVPFATQDETAAAGSDYVAAVGTLTLPPGSTAESIPVPVLGDATAELDETFRLELGTVVNATVTNGQAQGVILDDDAPVLPGFELTHGSVATADLAAEPGPTAAVRTYRLAQPPFTSWEVIVDGVSGDVAPGLLLERLGADASTVLQTASAVGTGGAMSLRFENRLAAPIVSQRLRVSSTGCGTDCGPDDVYRLRAFETTGRIPRYNNGGSQVTVVVLQNPTAQPVNASIDFWSGPGVRLATQAVSVSPHGVFVLNTASIPALHQTPGSITISNDAPFGALAGKVVSLEPATGFSFDSPMVYKPR